MQICYKDKENQSQNFFWTHQKNRTPSTERLLQSPAFTKVLHYI